MKKLQRMMALALAATLPCSAALASGVEQRDIPYMAQWPDLPTPYVTRDWQDAARKVTLLTFDAAADAKYFPVSYYFNIDKETSGGYTGPNFGTHTYLRQSAAAKAPREAVAQLAAVLTASMTEGLNPRALNGLDYVRMAQVYFQRTPDGRGFVNNNAPGTDCAGSFWYTFYPTILYFHLAAQYPEDAALTQHMREVADTWLAELPSITTWKAMGYSLRDRQLVFGGHTEPEGVFGAAYVMMMAYARFDDEKYLDAAVSLMRTASEFTENPYYEILGSYAPVIAARLNAEANAGLPLTRMMDWVFTDGSVARPGWGTIKERWGDYDAYGLAGSLTDTDGYAFAMNTFVTAGALAPVARYAPAYSRELGKYLTAVASNSHMFFADGLPAELQDDAAYVAETGLGYLVYEGVRHHSKKTPYTVPFATGDAKDFAPGVAGTTFSFYSSGPLGLFSSIVGETNVPEILCFDLLKTDFEHAAAYPTYLLYNPLAETRQVVMPLPDGGPWDVWDAVRGEYLGRDVSGEVAFALAADCAVQAVVLPAGAVLQEANGRVLANGIVVRHAAAWMDIQADESTMLRAGDVLTLDVRLMPGDRVTGYRLTMDGQQLAQGGELEAPYVIPVPEEAPNTGVLTVILDTANGERVCAAKALRILPAGIQQVMHQTGKELKKNFDRMNTCRVYLEDAGVRFKIERDESTFSLPMTLIQAEENPLFVLRMAQCNTSWGVKLFVNQNASTHVLRAPARGEGEFLFDLGAVLRDLGMEKAHVKVQLVIREDGGQETILQEIALYTKGE